MMRKISRISNVCIIFLLGFLSIPMDVSAEKIITYNYIMQMEYMYHQGMIQSVSPTRESCTVSGKKIYLVDVRKNQEHYKTLVKSPDGSETSDKELTVGKWIFVWGGVMRGGSVAAKDILILRSPLTEKEIERLPMIQKHDIWGGKRIRYD